jgi:hypothetical protein
MLVPMVALQNSGIAEKTLAKGTIQWFHARMKVFYVFPQLGPSGKPFVANFTAVLSQLHRMYRHMLSDLFVRSKAMATKVTFKLSLSMNRGMAFQTVTVNKRGRTEGAFERSTNCVSEHVFGQ